MNHGDKTNYFDLIPVDLFISNILSKLPVKSIAQCRCVSKLWSSIIRRPYNNLLFPIKSPAPPRILFTFEHAGELFFYSLPQPRNLDENTSLVATLHHRTRGKDFYVLSPPVGGLVCHQHKRKNLSRVAVISNPITGEFLALPKLRMDEVKREWVKVHISYIFGYDPIDKQLKVLRNTSSYQLPKFSQYNVLTFGSGNKNLLWRKTKCCTLHCHIPNSRAICISGILYYAAKIFNNIPCVTMACFDIRSENFSFINIDQYMSVKMKISSNFNLIDYKGKLGASYYDTLFNIFELWVLEDAEKHKWSKHIYQMPKPWLKTISSVCVAGMIGSGVIVFYPHYTQDQFFIFYYNLESNILTRVTLEVPLLVSEWCYVKAFTNYVGDVRLM